MALAKNTACVGLPPPAITHQKKPNSMIYHSSLLKWPTTFISVQREYSGMTSGCLPSSTLLDADLPVCVRLRWAGSKSSGSFSKELDFSLDGVAKADPVE